MRAFNILLTSILISSPVLAKDAPKKDSSATEDSSRVFFDVMGNELSISPPQIEFDLQSSNGESLGLGNGIVFNNESIHALYENNELRITWNPHLIQPEEVSIIDGLGKELLKSNITSVGHWSLRITTGTEGPTWKNGDRFHFCLRSQKNHGYSSLCSQTYAIVIDTSGIQIGKTRSNAPARILFQNKEQKLKGYESLTPGTPVQFLATLNTGASYEFTSAPLSPTIKDMIADGESAVVLTGALPRPLSDEATVVSGEQYGKLTRFLGFQKTIAEHPDQWQLRVPVQNAVLSFSGVSGGVFHYKLTIQNPPTEKDRLYLATPKNGTYLSQDKFIFKDSDGNLKENIFEAPQEHSLNRVFLDNSKKDGPRPYLDVYRGTAGEASLRLTGVGTADGHFVLLGEGHVAWWLNDLLGWQNTTYSLQRWGVSARVFSSIMDFPVKTSGGGREDVSLNVIQTDLRYRLTPGLWERDETLGLIAAYERIHVDEDEVSKLGGGLFWARSMPKSIDTWISKLPYMNHPKWVDMEFIAYLSSPDSDVQLKSDFVLNFHGKVLWTPRFFGEAGFGIKNYHYERRSDGSGAKLTTFYGTLGIGINF